MDHVKKELHLINQRIERLVGVLANYTDADTEKMLSYVMDGDPDELELHEHGQDKCQRDDCKALREYINGIGSTEQALGSASQSQPLGDRFEY